MYRAFNTAISGLQTNQIRMEVIGNNIANVNTTGFKGSRATFQEQFSQTLQGAQEPQGNRAGTNPQQVGLGASLASIDTIHTQGAIQTTGKNTDVALQGRGFLVLRDAQGSRLYTRDGNFGLDADRRLATNTGLLVQGYTADKNGVINTNGPIGDIVIEANRTYPPKASSMVELAGNLYRPARLSANEAFANSLQGTTNANVPVTGYGNGSGLLQLGTVGANNVLEAGELVINDISILGEVPLSGTETSLSALQKLSDLINFHRDKTGVVATVKSSPPVGGNPQAQIVLTALKPGPNQQVVVGGSALGSITLNGSQLFSAGTTTIETRSTNTGGQAQAGSITLASGDIVINGVDIGSLSATSAINTEEQNAQAIIGLINAKSDLTGVIAESDGSGRISFRATARDIIISGAGVSVGTSDGDPTPLNANVSGLYTDLNRAKTATVLAGTTTGVYDSLGTKHDVGLDFIADYDVIRDANNIIIGTRDKGVWNWAAASGEPDVAVLSLNTNGASNPMRNVVFNNQGILQNFSGNFTLNFLNTDAINANSIFNFNTNLSPNIAHPQPLTVDVGTVSDTNGLTQFSGAQTLTVANQDGYAAGDLTTFNIAGDGTIRGIFSNGQTLALGKLAVASFVNEAGLIRGLQNSSQGGNVYQETPNSGLARIGMAQSAGNGTLLGGALESSNVDIAQQFTDMIVTQRAFQANSRTITTADEMLQEVLSLRR